jgi:hypothetical protein
LLLIICSFTAIPWSDWGDERPIWTVYQPCRRSYVRIDHKEILDTTPENAVNSNLAILYADDGTRARIKGIVFCATTIRKDDNDFVAIF